MIFGCWDISKTVLGVFKINQKFHFYQKHPKLFCLYLSNQISLKGRFVFKTNGRISSITSYKDHCCRLFTSWVIKQLKKLFYKNFERTAHFGISLRTQKQPLKEYTSLYNFPMFRIFRFSFKGFCKEMGAECIFWKFCKFWGKFPNIAYFTKYIWLESVIHSIF